MSSPTSGTPSLQLVERHADGDVRFIALTDGLAVSATAGTQYALIDSSTGKTPAGLRLLRKGNALLVERDDGGDLVQIDHFFQQDEVTFVPDASADGGSLSGAVIDPSSPSVGATSAGEPVLWSSDANDGAAIAVAPASESAAWAGSTWGWIGAAVGVGAIAAASGGGGGGGSDAPPPTPPLTPTVNNVAGTIVGGPVIAGNDLRVDIYAANGTTKLGEGTVNANGSFTIAVGDYEGVVVVRVVNTGSGADYRDEATATEKDLNAQLFAVGVVTEPNSTVSLNVNALTTIAYQKAAEAAGSTPLTAEQVNSANAAIAAAFGLENLHQTTVEPLNGSGYISADGLNSGEQYGAILAALSGADAENGGNSQQTIDALVAGITITGGVATLDSAAQAVVVQGAERTSTATGEDLTADVIVLVDKTAPAFVSGDSATAITENSGADQLVYTAAVTDASAVTFSLKESGDAALFSINATTGAVTLIGNPDFETKSSYTFTVVATDVASNSSEQAVALAITNLDEVAPTITSGTTAAAINENSGASQVVYTVTSTDTGDISAGVTYSLKTGADAALFTINSATGAVTLTGNPDFEAKSSYSFTVVATDAANHGSERAVTLGINDVDEVAPTLSLSAPADNGSVAPSADIVLTFSENVQAGSGNIVITNGTDTRTIAVTDSSQVTISGDTVTINPTADLDQNSAYHVLIDNGALTDAAGNAYSGISNSTTLNFQTQNAEIVVFDLLEGVSSSHSSRTFDANTTYTIYIRVDSESQAMSTDGTSSNAGATWGVWTGGNNLGSDDRVVVVGDGGAILGIDGFPVTRMGFLSLSNGSANPYGTYIAYGRAGNDVVTRSAAHFHSWGSFARGATDISHFPHVDLWTGTWAAAPLAGGLNLTNNYLVDMPAGILTSQGLA